MNIGNFWIKQFLGETLSNFFLIYIYIYIYIYIFQIIEC